MLELLPAAVEHLWRRVAGGVLVRRRGGERQRDGRERLQGASRLGGQVRQRCVVQDGDDGPGVTAGSFGEVPALLAAQGASEPQCQDGPVCGLVSDPLDHGLRLLVSPDHQDAQAGPLGAHSGPEGGGQCAPGGSDAGQGDPASPATTDGCVGAQPGEVQAGLGEDVLQRPVLDGLGGGHLAQFAHRADRALGLVDSAAGHVAQRHSGGHDVVKAGVVTGAEEPVELLAGLQVGRERVRDRRVEAQQVHVAFGVLVRQRTTGRGLLEVLLRRGDVPAGSEVGESLGDRCDGGGLSGTLVDAGDGLLDALGTQRLQLAADLLGQADDVAEVAAGLLREVIDAGRQGRPVLFGQAARHPLGVQAAAQRARESARRPRRSLTAMPRVALKPLGQGRVARRTRARAAGTGRGGRRP